ncbi:hypothetical protein J2Z31_002638 [Sinorhizobium kostiense]|uniref:Transposase n=1 Tax=Sinorhizobium kostiense TaxID=76747 RepID=A0ABS4QZR5_9HYPH|nr:hypothetical protein [Sinorhizobium kostiense]
MNGRRAIITDTFATSANVHDSILYLDRADRQRKRFAFVKAVGLDAGYATKGSRRSSQIRRPTDADEPC